MLFGNYQRSKPSAQAIWKFWDSVAIQDTAMVGWWEDDAPVSAEVPTVRVNYLAWYRSFAHCPVSEGLDVATQLRRVFFPPFFPRRSHHSRPFLTHCSAFHLARVLCAILHPYQPPISTTHSNHP